VGGVGVVSVASHLVGDRIQQLIQLFLAGHIQSAIDLNLSLSPLFKGLFCMTNPIPIKAALNLVGWQVGGLRSPLCDLSPEFQPQLSDILRHAGLLT
jgi:4-hydroxy-tetrahydrodipicolinate synthase